jgi:NADH-quinone oxidoreductase subunit C
LSSPEATDTAEAEAPATDDAREAAIADLRDELGDAVLETYVRPGDDLWVRVSRDAWQAAGFALRDKLGAKMFEFLSAIDWLPSPYGKSEDSPTDAVPAADPDASAEIVTGYAGGDTRFQVFARALSFERKLGVTLKVDLPDDDLSLPTWIPVYAGANWHERETCEMFGITFVGHPHLVNIYLPGEFEGHPLRKDFPLLARHVKPWPGIVDIEPMPGEADGDEAEEG